MYDFVVQSLRTTVFIDPVQSNPSLFQTAKFFSRLSTTSIKMSRFHQPRLSIAIIYALFCINSSFASPVANADSSSLSIVDAVEPVNIIPIEDLPPERPFRSDESSTVNDGTTVTTTFKDPRNIAQRRNARALVSASEPVYVIPEGQIPSAQLLNTSGSSTNNDGNTVTTTYTTSRQLLSTKSNATSSLNLINTKNQTLADSEELDMGLNCEGSRIMCVGSAQMGVMHTLRDYMYAIPPGYRYFAGQDIACMKHNVYPNPWITWGFYCAFMQGHNVSEDGVDGALIQLKMQQMIEHHCLGCGSVPFSDDNDPTVAGILTVNYVRQSECEGLCYYKPPGIANAAVKVPSGMTLAS